MERQFKKTQNPKAEEKGETNDIVLTLYDSAISSREALKSVSQAPPLVTSMTVNTNILFDAETALFSDFT
ncbi:uncharacterized protein EAF02_004718 [Botrytis sinoallii]|uniref:uncharacterized protein n=1 Tax=Botrytis sinoallii TaxID=1463999 RepID=UPI0018FF1BAA|nr:uncharacterized protein EAF02_004718 [Botrytis sinoallii]KAF7884382.1 hypothetical protein EAF02_004718 [Botrytis sinoallii]